MSWSNRILIGRPCACASVAASQNANVKESTRLMLPPLMDGWTVRRLDGWTGRPSWSRLHSRTVWPSGRLAANFLESQVQNRVFPPVLVVKVPPLRVEHGEAFGLHGLPKQPAMPALERRPTRVVRIRAPRKLIITTHHLDRLPSLQVVQREIDGAPPV